MTFALRLCVVLLASYSVAALLLSALVALAWRAGVRERRLSSNDLLAMRLFPACGALLAVLSGVLPAFVRYEPPHEAEAVGPVALVLALIALAAFASGMARGWRACAAARRILGEVRTLERRFAPGGESFAVVDAAEPIVAVVGAWRPRTIAARSVLAACEPDELGQVLAHESAHVAARDNLKFLLQLGSPDPLAWLPPGKALTTRWRAATEFEADERAAGGDAHKRMALASALLKVARLSAGRAASPAGLSVGVASGDVAERVRRLLGARSSDLPRRIPLRQILAACALLIPAIALPLYTRIQDLVELLVRLAA
jgi:beta-lactamase regulating signal transducer with metallopeptidase domain